MGVHDNDDNLLQNEPVLTGLVLVASTFPFQHHFSERVCQVKVLSCVTQSHAGLKVVSLLLYLDFCWLLFSFSKTKTANSKMLQEGDPGCH